MPATMIDCGGNRVIVCTQTGRVSCFDIKSGSVQWSQNTFERITTTPTVDGDKIFLGSDDHSLYCFDLETGVIRNRYETKGAIRSAPCVFNNLVIFGSDDYNIYCLNADSFEVVWKVPTRFWVRSSPTIQYEIYWVHESVLIADWHDMCRLDVQNGDIRWQHPTDAEIWDRPLIHGEKVYFGNNNSRFHCLNAMSGSMLWFHDYDSEPVRSPVSIDDKRIAFVQGSNIIGCNADSGTILWQIENIGPKSDLIVKNHQLIVTSREGLDIYQLPMTAHET